MEAAEKRRKEKEEHSIEAYETKFKQIQEISGEPNLEKLVDKFIEGERRRSKRPENALVLQWKTRTSLCSITSRS